MRFLDRYKAALIDMDGVLYDSMPGHTLAWHQLMSELGIECDRDEFYSYEGMTGKATVNLLYERAFGHPATDDEAAALYARKADAFRRMPPPPAMPGAADMLRELAAAGLTRVLVTGSAQGSLLERLESDYPGVFPTDRRITALNVTHGKPAPEPYLKGAELAGYSTQECIVVENAPLGVRAGKAAGCFTIAVTTGPIPRNEFVREGADLIFDSMPDFAAWLHALNTDRPLPVLTYGNAPALMIQAAQHLDTDRVCIVTDSNVHREILPTFDGVISAIGAEVLIGAESEEEKDMPHALDICRHLSEHGYTRRSLMVCIGGGVVTDLGGFAAALFKRGMQCINIPTTVLGAADAAIGGKTAVNFNGLKNELGVFSLPTSVVVDVRLMATLAQGEVVNGLAEVIKTALVCNADLAERYLNEGIEKELSDSAKLGEAVHRAAEQKMQVVSEDLHESDRRRILNLGHTIGHALESESHRQGTPMAHGTAVAYGMLAAMIVSQQMLGFDYRYTELYRRNILKHFFWPEGFRPDTERIIELLRHDKKNRRSGMPEFVLLRAPGTPVAGITPDLTLLADTLYEIGIRQ